MHQNYAYALVLLFAFAEACIGIGLFISGLFLVTVSSWLYTSSGADLTQILSLAFVGAALGDHAGFYIGYWFGPALRELTFVKKRRTLLLRAEQLIIKYGAFAIFIGRLVPAIRSLVPAMLGISGFGRGHFTLLNFGACLIWSLGLGAIIVGVDNLF